MRLLVKDLWTDMNRLKHYFIAASLVFIIGVWLGATDERLISFLNKSLEGMGEIAGRIRSSDNPQLWFFLFIFLNNSIKSIFFVFIGAFFAILPLFVLVVNGMTLGYVVFHSTIGDLSPWMIIVKGILPHGLIELPAIILACAYGIRLGTLVMKGLIVFMNAERRAKVVLELKQYFRMTLPLVLLLTISLFIAAVIESTFTYWLMSG